MRNDPADRVTAGTASPGGRRDIVMALMTPSADTRLIGSSSPPKYTEPASS